MMLGDATAICWEISSSGHWSLSLQCCICHSTVRQPVSLRSAIFSTSDGMEAGMTRPSTSAEVRLKGRGALHTTKSVNIFLSTRIAGGRRCSVVIMTVSLLADIVGQVTFSPARMTRVTSCEAGATELGASIVKAATTPWLGGGGGAPFSDEELSDRSPNTRPQAIAAAITPTVRNPIKKIQALRIIDQDVQQISR